MLTNRNAYSAKDEAFKNDQCLTHGSLKKCIPMVVWSSSLKEKKDIKRAMNCETELTHSNKLVKDATFVYAATI